MFIELLDINIKMKQALILDSIDRGSTYSFLRASDFLISRKILKSSVYNWTTVNELLEIDSEKKTLIVGKFTEPILNRFLDEEYNEVAEELVNKLIERNHIVFIYSDNYHGYFNFSEGYADPEDVKNQRIDFNQSLKDLIRRLNDKGLNIVTYESLVDLEIASQSFIENIAQGLLLKFYIPNDKFGGVELDKFIILFKDFISSSSDKSVRIHQNRTNHGVICTLYSESSDISHDDVYGLFDDFTRFMEVCINDPVKAAEILRVQNVPKESIARIVSRHAKEAKRIFLDLKQDKERRLLQARQNLEAELLEEHIGTSEIARLIESVSPHVSGIKDVISESKVGTLNFNINPQIINRVEGVVAKEFHGQVTLTKEDEQLKLLIEKFSTSLAETAELNSSFHEINDPEIAAKEKKFAASRLKNFVLKNGEKIGDIGFSLLTKYLENKMGFE